MILHQIIENGRLKKPIIHPCRKDWRIRWTQNEKVIKDDKIKRFGNIEIDHSSYMIIMELPVL